MEVWGGKVGIIYLNGVGLHCRARTKIKWNIGKFDEIKV